jgi:trans-aconitate 2-methyltransferase
MPHEFNGEAYKQSSTHQKEWGTRIISEIHFSGREHILDLGCGDGVLTALLAGLAPQGYVLGIDSSQGMIEVARRIQRSNLRFELRDINYLDYKSEFDLVFSNAVLHWVKDHNRLLDNVFKGLKKDGLARFNFGSAGNCVHFHKVIRSAMKHPEYSGYFKTFEWPWYMPPVEEYELLVRRLPFREIKIGGEIADRYFPDVSAMVKWVDQPSLVPFLEAVPEPDKQGFRNFVVEKMIEETRQDDGRCFETFRRINVLARK